MVFGAPLIDAGIGVLILVALAQYAKVRDKSEKGYNWLAAGGVLLLFSGLFVAAPALGNLLGGVWTGLEYFFEVVGWIFALVGVVFVAYETVVEK